MPISYRASSAAVTSGSATVNVTASATPTLPAGTVAGDRVLIVAVGTSTIQTPASWSVAFASTSLGGGTAADTTGARDMAIFYRDYDGVWAMPAVTVSALSGVGPGIVVGGHALSAAAGETFDAPATIGASDATSRTAHSAVTGAFTVPASSILLMLWGFPLNISTVSSPSVTATGLTTGSFTVRHNGTGPTTGRDAWLVDHTAAPTAGSSAVAHAATMTTVTAGTGGVVLLAQTVTANVTKAITTPSNRARYRASLW